MFFEGKKGGALASIVHSHLQHGDPQVRSVIKNMLATVATPIFQTVLKWIFDGELDDNFHEVQKKKMISIFNYFFQNVFVEIFCVSV